jgi:hypothetical protein
MASIRKWPKLPWDVMFLMGVVFTISWGATFTRGAVYLGNISLYFPIGRNAYPAIVPTMLLFCVGWLEIMRSLSTFGQYLSDKLRFTHLFESMYSFLSNPNVQIGIIFVFFIMLDIISIYSILMHYGFLSS